MRAKKAGIVVSFVLAVFFLLPHAAGAARFYKYADKDGNVHITDNLESVPQEYRTSLKIIEFADEQPQKSPQEKVEEKPSKSAIKIDPDKISIPSRSESSKPSALKTLKEEQIKIIVIIASIFLGGFIFSFLINRFFKRNIFLRMFLKLALVIIVVVGLYYIFLSYLGRQLAPFMPAGEEKTLYTPSDILKQAKEIAEQAQKAGQRRQGQLEELTE